MWVQQVSGGDPVQVTKGRGYNWQPDWSPDGKYIAYRGEDGDGGLFIVPALGGEGLSRKVAPFGYSPHWSPDGSEILFQLTQLPWTRFFVVSLDGSQPHEILTEFTVKHPLALVSAAWHPDGMRVTVWARTLSSSPAFGPFQFWEVRVSGQRLTLKLQKPSAKSRWVASWTGLRIANFPGHHRETRSISSARFAGQEICGR